MSEKVLINFQVENEEIREEIKKIAEQNGLKTSTLLRQLLIQRVDVVKRTGDPLKFFPRRGD